MGSLTPLTVGWQCGCHVFSTVGFSKARRRASFLAQPLLASLQNKAKASMGVTLAEGGPSQLHRLLFSSLCWSVCGCPPAERSAWKSDLGPTLTRPHPWTLCLAKIRTREFWDKQPSLRSPKGRLSPPQRNSHQPSGSVLIADVAVGCGPQLVSQDVNVKDGFTPATHGPRDFKDCNSPWQP